MTEISKTQKLFSCMLLMLTIVLILSFKTTYAESGTEVGGIIWENTTWTMDDSPFLITNTVQIPENVTLTIQQGVTVLKPKSEDVFITEDMFLLNGIIYAHGTEEDPIIFDGGGNSNFFSAKDSESDTFLDLNYCILKNGESFWPATGHSQSGYFSLKNSQIINLKRYSYVWYPENDVYIENNSFIYAGGFSIGHLDADVHIRNNLFYGKNPEIPEYQNFTIENWASYENSKTIVENNSFINIGGIVLQLPSGYDNANIIAINNYWGTTNTSLIDSMIYDMNDDISCASFIEYLPFLDEPNPNTPISPEEIATISIDDIQIDVEGQFIQISDGNWRCFGNLTLKNECERVVNLNEINIDVINATFPDGGTLDSFILDFLDIQSMALLPHEEFSQEFETLLTFADKPQSVTLLIKSSFIDVTEELELVDVIPEFSSWIILPLFLMGTSAIIELRKKMKKNTEC